MFTTEKNVTCNICVRSGVQKILVHVVDYLLHQAQGRPLHAQDHRAVEGVAEHREEGGHVYWNHLRIS